MIPLFYDLHMHSCLSPCGDEDMTPGNLVGMAMIKGLQLIALTDHNSARNCPAAAKHAGEYGITFIPGMELTTQEEVHVVCLFPTLDDALSFDDYVHKRIQKVKNKPEYFGHERVMDEYDSQTAEEELLLINATSITFDSSQALVESFHGVMIPAHVDASSNGLLSNLGFVPPDSRFTTVEYHDLKKAPEIEKVNPYLAACRKICDSDAHYLENIHEAQYVLHVEENSPEAVIELLKSPKISH